MKKLLVIVAVLAALVASAPSAETVASVAGAVGIESASAEPFYCDGVPIDNAAEGLLAFVSIDHAAACGGGAPQQISDCVWSDYFNAYVAHFWSPWTGHYVGYC